MNKIKEIIAKAFGLCGAIIGFVVGGMVVKYLGLVLFYPVVGGLIGYIIFGKIIKPISRALLSVCIILSAQLFWHIIGFLLVGKFNLHLVSVLIGFGLLAWLIITNSRASVIFLMVSQSLDFILNLNRIIFTTFGTDKHRILLTHMILQFIFVCIMIIRLKYPTLFEKDGIAINAGKEKRDENWAK